MPPRGTVNCDPETSGRINGRPEVQALRRENGTITTGSRTQHAHRLVGKGNAVPASAGEIPWRTSRRLQEATLRLIKERDGGYTHNHVSVKEEDDFRGTESLLPVRSPKRRPSESEPAGEKQEDQPAEVPAEDSGNPSVAEAEEQASSAVETTPSIRARRKVKRRKAQFNDALHLFTQDESKAIASSSSNDDDVPDHVSSTPATTCNRTAGAKVEPTIAGSDIPSNTVMKQPQSCFDLLCSHVGFRGWRCYRACVVGQAFCVYHRRESTPVGGICLYT